MRAHAAPSVLTGLVVLSLVILFLVLFIRRLNQPYFVAYILSGVILGQQGLWVLTNPELIAQLGESGIILLLFLLASKFGCPT